MHVPTVLLLCLPIATALERRQAEAPPPPFSGNAAQLISLYIPDDIKTSLYNVYTSVESTTGNPASVIESAFTATNPPSWLSAAPTEYQSNIEALQSAVESLRVAATGGIGASVTLGASSALITSASVPSSEVTQISGTRSATGSESASESDVTQSSRTNEPTSGLNPNKPTPSFIWGSSTSSQGLSVPTKAPVALAGVLGALGAVLAL